jgi:hypothetical protein
MMLPGTPAGRRRAALAFLALGLALAVGTLSRDLPHEQILIFRLGETERHVPLTLHVSLTRVGESEACAGLTVTRTGSERTDPRQTLRLPDGDYVVTAHITPRVTADQDEERDESRDPRGRALPKEDETSRVERVTLTGGEISVPLAPRARE